MPLPIELAHRLACRLAEARKDGTLAYLRPDGKTQVTVRYDIDEHGHRTPIEIERVLISTQHREGIEVEATIKPDLIEHVIRPILKGEYSHLLDDARLAAYAARYVATNVVAAGLAHRCQVQVAYAIGVAQPVSISAECFGTAVVPEARIEELIREHFDLRPAAIVRDLDLRRPIYAATAAYGHFGRRGAEFSWERTDRADALRTAAGLLPAETGARCG